MMNDKYEVVVVTGASAGLGRAVAVAFAKRGASEGLIARSGAVMDGLEGAKKEVEPAAQKTEEEPGPIDVWVNNAMTSVFGPVKELQPVPPIYQLEVAAEADHWAAHHDRREVFVGTSTDVAILGNKPFPQVRDWYLGQTGFKSQQRPDQPKEKDASNNLYMLLPGDQTAHEPFDDKVKNFSPQLWLSLNRKWLASVGLAGLAVWAAAGQKNESTI